MPRMVPCASCAKPIQIGPGSRSPGESKCRSCWRAEIVHGSVKRGYRKGCRCNECREAKNADMRAYQKGRRERTGYQRNPYRTYVRPYQPLRPCTACEKPTRARGDEPLCKGCAFRSRRMVYLTQDERRAIYERDGWVCGFCECPVDPALSGADDFGPTLDHIVPRSLGGSDDEANLRLVHRYCNAVRSNREALTINELAA